jgi:hypothetical protein
MVKMRKLGKKRALLASWEGSYAFMKYRNEKGCKEFDDGNQVYIINDLNGKQWEHARHDLQVFN